MAASTYDRILRLSEYLELPEQLELIETLTRMVRARVAGSTARSIMELEGLGAEIWREVDAQEYVNQERATWGSR